MQPVQHLERAAPFGGGGGFGIDARKTGVGGSQSLQSLHGRMRHDRIVVRQQDTCLIIALLEPIKHLSERSHDFRYPQLVHHIREIAGKVLPAEAAVLVLSKGDDELLKLKGRKASHFPRGEGDLAGHRYLDSTAAIGHLEVQRAKGGAFLILPQTSFFWLENCREFRQHLDACYKQAWRDEYCIIYQLACPEESVLKQISRRLDYVLGTLNQLRESSGDVDNRLAKVEEAAASNKLQSEEFARELEARVIRVEQAAEADDAGLAELVGDVKAQAARLEKVAKNVERLGNRFLARPYMARELKIGSRRRSKSGRKAKPTSSWTRSWIRSRTPRSAWSATMSA